MKQTIKNLIKLSFVLLGLNFSNLNAQTNGLQMLEAEYNNSDQLFSITPHPSWSKTPLTELPKLIGEAYGITSNFTFKVVSEEIEEKYTFTSANQMIGNYPVVGGDMIFKRDKSGNLLVIMGTLREPESVSHPAKTKEEALSVAHNFLKISEKDYFSNGLVTVQPKIELKYANIGGIQTNKVVLCYELLIMTEEPAEWYIYVNARNGMIEYSYNRLHVANGTGTTLYSGNKNINTKYVNPLKYLLIDTARNIETKNWRNTNLIANGNVLYDTNNVFDSAQQKPGVDVHWGMGLVYDYYLNIHGRKSYDGLGGKITNNVRFKTNYNNAFFSSGTHEMYYGKGNGARWADLVALDIVGHEFSHSLVNATANLVYQAESGALNESFADIFGHCIELTGKASNWLMGEECFTPGAGGDALRDMSNPNNSGDATGNGKCPDTYKGTYWKSLTGGDNGGVHYNSGVQNYWFYLLTVGGSGTNDAPLNHSFSVTGIGQQKSEKIAYRNLTRYLTSSSDFRAARKGSLLAAEDLYGKNSNEYQQVCNAWYAVGVGEKCCTGNDSLILSFKIKDTKCHDSKDGEIELTVKNKLGSTLTKCEYYWHKGDTTTAVLSRTKDIFNLDSGRYVVIVKDTVAHCEAVDKAKVNAPEKVKLSISGSGEHKGACERSITVVLAASASGGTSPYTYNWANARQEIVMSGSNGFTHDYTGMVTDKNGCKGDQTAKVTYIPVVCSYDPNDIIGPPSYGDPKWVSIKATLPYKIRYENDPKFATGPAQKVSINHKLDSNTDLTSFRLMSFGFYKYSFDVPENATTYSKRLDLRDSFGIFLDVTAGLDVSAREAFWIFESIDPATGLPPSNGNKGYLAVNDTITHKGEGFVNYSIMAKQTAKTGDSIRAKAIIVFDDNSAVPTPRIFNLIDAKPPSTYIKGVASIIDSTIVPLTLRGKDDTGGSGMGNFDVYVSENSGGYNRYAKAISDTLINFRGNYGSSYTAYSIGADNVENREKDKTSPDISFSIASKEFFKPITSGTSLCSGDTLRVRWLRSVVNSITLQYSADSGQTFNTIATGLAGTDTLYRWKIPSNITGIKKYIIRAVNGNNSTIIDTSDYFELKQGPAISLGPDTSFCDGTSFSLTLNPGSGYSSYKWSDSSTTSTKTVTAYGTYWVKVKASTGCKATEEIIVSKNLLPQIASVNNTSPLCFGESNGTIDITVVSGHAPYNYLWSNAATSQDLTNIAAGNYSVTVTDSKGCVANEATTLTQPAKLATSHTITFVKCFGGNDGAVDVTIAGGTTPYTYIWSNAATSQDISSLVAGTYRLEVTDKNNCVIRDTSVVTQPSILVKSHTSVNVKCFGNSTGSIDLTITGGTTAYSYSWTSTGGGSVPSGQSTSQDLSNILAGVYHVMVTDANNCVIRDTVTITQPSAALASSKTQVDVKCYGNSTGSIDLTVTGGTTGYTYAWTASSGGVVPSGQSSNQDLTGLVAGAYNVTITDANNCTTTNSASITQPSAALSSSKSQVNVFCYGNSTGSIDLSVTGGTTGYTYAWTASGGGSVPTGQSANQDLTGLLSGTYTVTITDANSCTTTNSATITQPTAPLATSKSQVNVLCFGNSTGSIDLSVTGGTTGYAYAWTASGGGSVPSGQSANQDLTGLNAGTYNVTVTDANNCTSTNSATITQPSAALASSKTQVDVKCYGNSTGSIDLTVTGGTSGYTYAWTASSGGVVPSGQSSNQDLTGLVAGAYNVTITDANNCTTTNSASITQPSAALASTKSQVNVLCFGNSTGSIDLSVTGGTTGYTYVWTATGGGSVPSGQSTNQDLTGLVAGTYNVTITDANNCTSTNSASITQPSAALASTKSQVNVLCFGNSTGSIDLSVTGGTTAYTYAWSASGGGVIPTGQSTNQDLTGLVAGTYNVTITDGNNCTNTNSATITQPSAALASSKTQIDVDCFGNATGSIDLTVSGGTTGYTYLWTASSGGAVPSGQSANQDLTLLRIGVYNVLITDANNCTSNNSVTITQPTLLTISNSITDVKCFAQSNGGVNATISGGVTPYSYSWTNGGTNEDIINVVAGSYTLTVTDKNGCNIQTTGVVNQPALLVATHSISDVRCHNGSDGSINLNITGGITPYNYLWNSSDVSEDISGKPAGNYKVTITDKNLCLVKDSGVISQPVAPLSSNIAMIPVNCFGGSDGSANLSVAGGTSPYTYAWSNGKTTEDILGLALGKYYVKITDANNCLLLDTVDVTQPLAPLTTGITKLDVKCFAGSDGSANLTVNGGTTPYSFAWSNLVLTEDISGVIFGKYIVTITDKNLCQIKDSITISQPAAPLSSVINASAVNCFGGGDGSITLTVSGGTLNYNYLWSNGSTTKDISNLITGKYNVTVTDANSCILKDSIIVSQPLAALLATHIVTDAKCKNSKDGIINLNVTGGTLPYLFAWSNSQTSEDAITLGAGRYVVNITDKNGCKFKDSADVKEPDSLKINADGTTATEGESNGFVFVTVVGGTQPYTYFWNGSTSGGNDTLFDRPFGAYIIRVVDGNGCSQTDTFIIEEAPPTSLLRLGPNPSRGSLTVFDLESFGLDLPIYFELFDMQGRLRMDFMVQGLSTHTFPLGDSLYNDSYILRIYNDRYEERRKIYLLR